MPDCVTNEDCGPGTACEDKRCVASNPGGVGAPCRINAGCASERCEITYNGGYCTDVCAQDGPSASFFNKGCSSGGTCARVSEAAGLCLSNCASDGDCRDEYFCDREGGSGVCRPRCRGNTSCALGHSCHVAGGGRCIEGSALPRQTGARCATDDDCDSFYCLNEPDQGFPNGLCSADCTNDLRSCESAGLCILPSDPALASVCLQRCQSNFDCRADYFCSAVSGSTLRVCIPRCTARDSAGNTLQICTAPEVCDPYSGDCVPPQPPGSTTIERVDIGQMAISGSESTQDFTIAVPAGAISFTLVMKGSVGGVSTIERLIAPSGELLFDLDNYLTSKVRILPVNDGDFGMLFPNTPRVEIQPGTYRFRIVNEDGSGTGQVFALIKRSTSTVLSTGKLNLNLWFAGVNGVSAATAASDVSVQTMLAEMRRIYAQAGITIADVSYFDVPAAQGPAFAVIDTIEGRDSELRRLFELSVGAPNNAMNFFLVREIKGGGAGFTVLGIAGGIPGIPFEQGTNASGVAVTTLDLQSDPKSVARTMAHEGGHWLGLWHTTEQSGKLHDPLSDTPECSAARDSNQDKIVSAAECQNSGAENLMFWQAGPTAERLSGNQGYVLLRNPVVTSP